MHLQRDVGTYTAFFAGEVHAGRLNSSIQATLDMSNYFYDLPTTPKRRNRYLFPDSTNAPLRVHSINTLFGDKEGWSRSLVSSGKFVCYYE
jgi:UDP-glucose:glycoprotein glucosyltransferase